jgi:hypothetical protein
MEEYVAAGGCGSISKAAYNGTQVAVKAITLYSQKDNSQAERVCGQYLPVLMIF